MDFSYPSHCWTSLAHIIENRFCVTRKTRISSWEAVTLVLLIPHSPKPTNRSVCVSGGRGRCRGCWERKKERDILHAPWTRASRKLTTEVHVGNRTRNCLGPRADALTTEPCRPWQNPFMWYKLLETEC